MPPVVLAKTSRARAVQLPAWNEALGLPRPWDQQWSLRLQQIMAYETDLLEFNDIFSGSQVLRNKVNDLKGSAHQELKNVDEFGGLIQAIENGYMKSQLVKSQTQRQRHIETVDKKDGGGSCIEDGKS